MTTPSTSEQIDALLRLPAVAEYRAEVTALVRAFQQEVAHPLRWQRAAGRAFAEEGLDTLEITNQTKIWVERARIELLGKLRKVLRVDSG